MKKTDHQTPQSTESSRPDGNVGSNCQLPIAQKLRLMGFLKAAEITGTGCPVACISTSVKDGFGLVTVYFVEPGRDGRKPELVSRSIRVSLEALENAISDEIADPDRGWDVGPGHGSEAMEFELGWSGSPWSTPEWYLYACERDDVCFQSLETTEPVPSK